MPELPRPDDRAGDIVGSEVVSARSASGPYAGTARRRTAAFFDLDKTIIAKSSTLAFGRPFFQGGLINRRAVLKSTLAQFVYLVGGADGDQMDRMRDYVASLVAGWDAAQVSTIVTETLRELIDPLIYDEAATLIEGHHAAGRDVVIVSSSGEEIVDPIGAMLGAEHVIATRMVVTEGRYTGEIAFYCHGASKADALHDLAERQSYDLTASYGYSDSITDLAMLEVLGRPSAVNPDRALRKEAESRGWPVLEFRRPVSLRDRLPALPTPSRGVVLVATAAGAAVGLVFAWSAIRRGTSLPALRGMPSR